MSDTNFLCEVAHAVNDSSLNWLDLEGKVTVKIGNVSATVVELPDLEHKVVSAVSGSVRFQPYSLSIYDRGSNYEDMTDLCVSGENQAWRFREGPEVGMREITFVGFVSDVSGAAGDLDTALQFEIQIKPISDVTIGTVSA